MTLPAIIIPTYNERENITKLVKTIIKLLPNSLIYVVDDNSPDKTSDAVEKLTKKYQEKIFLIKRKSKEGRGSAAMRGFEEALKEKSVTHLIEMDADFSHDPSELTSLILGDDDKTIIIASRYHPESRIIGWSFKRHIFSRLANLYARLFLGVPIRDYTNGFRCYPREVLEKLDLSEVREKGYTVLSEMAYILFKKGVRFSEVATVFRNRKRGSSNTTLSEILNSFFSILRIRFF